MPREIFMLEIGRFLGMIEENLPFGEPRSHGDRYTREIDASCLATRARVVERVRVATEILSPPPLRFKIPFLSFLRCEIF